jgi:hypothetical protein
MFARGLTAMALVRPEQAGMPVLQQSLTPTKRDLAFQSPH